MEKAIVEKDWITKAGLRAVVLLQPSGFRCGYVAVEEDSVAWGVPYNSPRFNDIDVHGGLSYGGAVSTDDYPVLSPGAWWLGFDCGHWMDAPEPGGYMAKTFKELRGSGIVRTTEYVAKECESLAIQLVALGNEDDAT